jgi:molybdopterin converting factor small subunit
MLIFTDNIRQARWLRVVPDQKIIKVKVYLPPYFKRTGLDEQGYSVLESGSTLKDLFEKLKIPFPAGTVHLCRLNYENATLQQKLEDGDTVSFFSLISGG